jgi:hypothetical protein
LETGNIRYFVFIFYVFFCFFLVYKTELLFINNALFFCVCSFILCAFLFCVHFYNVRFFQLELFNKELDISFYISILYNYFINKEIKNSDETLFHK